MKSWIEFIIYVFYELWLQLRPLKSSSVFYLVLVEDDSLVEITLDPIKWTRLNFKIRSLKS